MPHNNAFQPKNARIVSTFDDDDDDLDDASLFGSSTVSSTKKTSGTQALADFLNTTSPEEFQRPTPASTVSTQSSNSGSSTFFRLRKNKRPAPSISSSTSSPVPTPTTTISTLGDMPSMSQQQKQQPQQHQRQQQQQQQQQQQKQQRNKKNIEIVPPGSANRQQQKQQQQQQQQYHQQQQVAKQQVSLHQRSLSRAPISPTASLSSSHQSLALREPQSPILPNRRRESSLYSGSLRNNTTRGKFSDYGSSGQRSTHTGRRMIMDLFENTTTTAASTTSNNNNDNNMFSSNTNSTHPKEIDHIDSALLQRLEQFIHNPETRQDVIESVTSSDMKTRHEEGSREEEQQQQRPSLLPTTTNIVSSKRRHCQTQTTQTCITEEPLHILGASKSSRQQQHPSSSSNVAAPGTTVEHLERQIAEEKRRQKRLQAAMQESCDQFEVLSGLAYMKLRELWEERMRWEEAYFALSERLDEIRQEQGGGSGQSADHHGGVPVVVNSTAPQSIMESVP